MAKHLFIIRHAKSDWTFRVSDFDRPLNERGFKDAPKMAERLVNNSYLPEFLVSSPAKRALTTAQIFAEILNYPSKKIASEAPLYEATIDDILHVINQLDDNYQRVALFGHNPGLSEIVSYLSGDGYVDLPTCGIVHLQFDQADQWQEISGGTARILNFIYPRDRNL